MEAWYMKEIGEDEDQRLPHHCEPKQYVSLQKLADLGVLHWHLEGDNYESNEELQRIRHDRGYTYSDTITCSPDKLPNYDAKLKSFFEEHIHTDEEIRLVLEGSGYFDVRDQDDRWIRMELCIVYIRRYLSFYMCIFVAQEYPALRSFFQELT